MSNCNATSQRGVTFRHHVQRFGFSNSASASCRFNPAPLPGRPACAYLPPSRTISTQVRVKAMPRKKVKHEAPEWANAYHSAKRSINGSRPQARSPRLHLLRSLTLCPDDGNRVAIWDECLFPASFNGLSAGWVMHIIAPAQ